MEPQSTFGDLIRSYRRREGLTQEELAERAEMSPRALIYLERGVRRPQPATARRLADALTLSGQERDTFLAAVEQDVASSTATLADTSAVRTFLIADIRGYTRFTVERGDEAGARLADRFALVAREIVGAHGGEVLELRGDEALAVFDSPRRALRAAVALQESVAEKRAHDTDLPLNVGIGLDAGEAVPVQGGFRGTALNLAARLCSVARAGEVFASETVINLARNMDGIAYIDRGVVQLKGLAEPVRVTQVAAEGAVLLDAGTFTVKQEPQSNLPEDQTSFVGRKHEMARIADMVLEQDVRLITLTGPGGTGKTRLAIETAREMPAALDDGVFLVALAPIRGVDLVVPAIAAALGVKDTGRHPLLQTLKEYLREKQILLILDNFEHVLEAAPSVTELLTACPGVRIVVTSREILRIAGEHVFAVSPLSVPDPAQLPDFETLRAYDGVTLFLQRARAGGSNVVLDGRNARTLAEICHRLDGLPLAIELAAAWVRVLAPEAMLERLENRLDLLVRGPRNLPARQQTLRATIDWSYDLLDEGERTLFARLSVFTGGCTLDAVEGVCPLDATTRPDVLHLTSSLVDKSLLRPLERQGEETRFLMLETLREYAWEKLETRGERETIRHKHAQFYLDLAETAQSHLSGPDQAIWLARLEADLGNLRAALGWALESREIESGYRVAAALWQFWRTRGYLGEARRWIESLLQADASENNAAMEDAPSQARARALVLGGGFAANQSDYDRARQLTGEGLDLYQRLNDRAGIATALNVLGTVAFYQSDYDRATGLYEESLSLRRELGDRSDVAASLNNLAIVVREKGDKRRAAALYGESLEIQRSLGDTWGIATVLTNIGDVARENGSYTAAIDAYRESLTLRRELQDTWGMATTLNNLGQVVREQGDLDWAAGLFAESLELCRSVGDRWRCAECLEELAGIALDRTQPDLSARLLGAASAIRQSIGAPRSASARASGEALVDAARASLEKEAFAAAWAAGEAMTLEEAQDDARLLTERSGLRSDSLAPR